MFINTGKSTQRTLEDVAKILTFIDNKYNTLNELYFEDKLTEEQKAQLDLIEEIYKLY